MPTKKSTIWPMKVQVRAHSRSGHYYKKNAGLPGHNLPQPSAIAPGINPAPLHDLIFHGGKTVPQMQYKNYYVGGTASWDASDIASIDTALAAAMFAALGQTGNLPEVEQFASPQVGLRPKLAAVNAELQAEVERDLRANLRRISERLSLLEQTIADWSRPTR